MRLGADYRIDVRHLHLPTFHVLVGGKPGSATVAFALGNESPVGRLMRLPLQDAGNASVGALLQRIADGHHIPRRRPDFAYWLEGPGKDLIACAARVLLSEARRSESNITA